MNGFQTHDTTDRILGSDELKRSTKTYIGTERAALLLGAMRNHAEGVTKAVQLMAEEELGRKLTVEEVEEMYPGVRAWRGIHQELVEHYASQDGFTLRVSARLEALRAEAQHASAESSVRGGDELGQQQPR